MKTLNKFRLKKVIDNFDILIFYFIVSSILLVGITFIGYFMFVKNRIDVKNSEFYAKLIKYVTVMEVSYEKVINHTACDIDVQARRVLVVEDNNSRRSLLTQSLKAEPIPLKGEKWGLKPDSFGGFSLDHKIELRAQPQPLKREQIWYTIGDASHP